MKDSTTVKVHKYYELDVISKSWAVTDVLNTFHEAHY